MMRTRHRSKRSRRVTGPNNVLASIQSDLTRSLVYALGTTGITQSEAAESMRVSESWVNKAATGKLAVNVSYVLRSSVLAVPFARHLCRLVVARHAGAR